MFQSFLSGGFFTTTFDPLFYHFTRFYLHFTCFYPHFTRFYPHFIALLPSFYRDDFFLISRSFFRQNRLAQIGDGFRLNHLLPQYPPYSEKYRKSGIARNGGRSPGQSMFGYWKSFLPLKWKVFLNGGHMQVYFYQIPNISILQWESSFSGRRTIDDWNLKKIH